MPREDSRTRTSKASGSNRLSSSTRDDESDSSTHDIPSDYELFDRATTPRDYIEDDESTFWEIKGIVSEEVDLSKRTIYQVDWSPWKDYDGTSTTWETYLEGPNTIIVKTRLHESMSQMI
ncbi:uncharacterized protein FOMMEDRAFT_155251 [Fomitiporia mediterranea MF3/22]|uniref:uncharacterized protein n=1 Tax=Fomitiporia mediterranea (strain MF3/22) TaxID=694068 RepID=UPI0004407C80|nr:uncharacterized protein FOMMEDRAFT_155251 [Fomitiporia mediterranea MF3/22]EJD04126.1 hypothetical protein FOMMEDRAFT_155251 [Fomitiporia mediterranea MF3/22]